MRTVLYKDLPPQLPPPLVKGTSPSSQPYPPNFSGDRSAGKVFLMSCRTYIRLCPDPFDDDEMKIMWVMSYMITGHANRWVTHEFEHETKTGHLCFIDWLDFEEEF